MTTIKKTTWLAVVWMLALVGAVSVSAAPEITKYKLSEITGYKRNFGAELTGKYESLQADPTAVEWKFDWRDEVAVSSLPPIRNQRNCGSCWAFGTTAILNWAYAILEGKPGLFSEQEILSCSKQGTCGGGYFAHDYQLKKGASLDSEFPYVARDVRCKANLSHQTHIVDWGYVGARGRRPTAEEMKAAIKQHGPIAVTITANASLQRFTGSTVFKGCTKGVTNHIVHIVGWDDEKGSWIMGNSWGADWGNKGYALIPYGCSRIGEQSTWVQLSKVRRD